MEKVIKNYEDYTIDEDGNIYSYKYKEKHLMKPWLDSKGNYLIIGLCKNNIVTKFLVHRLVAETFIPNPNNLLEVDHIDKNKQNNKVSNLHWCDRQFNLKQSYTTMSPVRNYKVTKLTMNNKIIGYFQSTSLACRYAEQKGTSYSSLMKYKHSGSAEITQIDVTTIENEAEVKIITSLTEVE